MSLTPTNRPNAEISVAVAVATEELRRQVTEAVQKLGSEVNEVQSPGDLDALVAYAQNVQPGVLFLGLPGLSSDMSAAVSRLSKLDPAPRIVAVSDRAEPAIILKAIRAGASEFVYPPFETEFEEGVLRVLAEASRPRESTRAAGKVIGFTSGKGGCGATTLACHSASWLRTFGKKEVLLADLDTAAGIASLLMQAAPRYTLDDVAQNLHRLDLKLWKALVSHSPSGVEVIAPPIEPAVLPVARKLPQMLRFWRGQYDFTMVDLGHGLTPSLFDTLDSLDTLVLVTTNELTALRKTKEIIQVLSTRDFGANRLKLVINRMPKRVSIQLSELEKLLGQDIYTAIPSDYPSLNDAYSDLRLLSFDSELGRRMGEFAANLAQIPVPEKMIRKIFPFR